MYTVHVSRTVYGVHNMCYILCYSDVKTRSHVICVCHVTRVLAIVLYIRL